MTRQGRRFYLRAWRELRGHTQQEVADALGITKTHVSNLERGERRYNEGILEAAAKFFGFEVDEAYYMLMDPTDPDGPWAMLDAMRNAPPGRVTDIRRIAGALAERPAEPVADSAKQKPRRGR